MGVDHCSKCQKQVSGDYLRCSACHKGWHFGKECYGMYLSTWNLKSADAKLKWKCKTCSGTTKETDTPSLTLADVLTGLSDVKEDITGQIKGLSNSVEFMSQKYDDFLVEMQKFQLESAGQQKKINDLEAKQKYLYNELTITKNQLHELEQYTRNKNVEIHGIEAHKNENVMQLVGTLAKKLKLPEDIDVAHRLPARNGKIPVIIISLLSRTSANLWLNHRNTGLKSKDITGNGNSTIYINENLTSYHKELFRRAKQFAKTNGYKYCWVKGPKIFIKKDEKSRNFIIKNASDLDSLEHGLEDVEAVESESTMIKELAGKSKNIDTGARSSDA